ncbi:MAG: NAD(+)/NADH kinase [Methanolinea sp.]|nr:NAD(+)/NADH kinase [Methanolinea sp.]
MRIALVARVDEPGALSFAKGLGEKARTLGHDVSFEPATASALGIEPAWHFDASVDIVIVVGGDGTILHTIQQMHRQVPVIGVNWGEVGFLADLEPQEAIPFLERLGEGFGTERRMRIALVSGGTVLGEALNEALVVTSRPAKMLRFVTFVDGIEAESFRADGLLVSTPTGSTAYAMSAGGPIVDPRIQGFLLVPLAPYMLSSRPHLISNDRDLEVCIESAKPATLVIDGQKTLELGTRARLKVIMAEQPALFVDAGKNFFRKVDHKLRRL